MFLTIKSPLILSLFSLLLLNLTTICQGELIADYGADFNPKDPKKGWSYLWNPEGVEIGNHKKYKKLEISDGHWCYIVKKTAVPGAESRGPWNATWLMLTEDKIAPGDGPKSSDKEAVSTDGLDHYAIAAFRVPKNETGVWSIQESSIQREMEHDSAEIRIYVNDKKIKTKILKSDQEEDFDVKLGKLKRADMIYVAMGPNEISSVSAKISYQIHLE